MIMIEEIIKVVFLLGCPITFFTITLKNIKIARVNTMIKIIIIVRIITIVRILIIVAIIIIVTIFIIVIIIMATMIIEGTIKVVFLLGGCPLPLSS